MAAPDVGEGMAAIFPAGSGFLGKTIVDVNVLCYNINKGDFEPYQPAEGRGFPKAGHEAGMI